MYPHPQSGLLVSTSNWAIPHRLLSSEPCILFLQGLKSILKWGLLTHPPPVLLVFSSLQTIFSGQLIQFPAYITLKKKKATSDKLNHFYLCCTAYLIWLIQLVFSGSYQWLLKWVLGPATPRSLIQMYILGPQPQPTVSSFLGVNPGISCTALRMTLMWAQVWEVLD